MEMKHQSFTDEEFIAFISKSMDRLGTDLEAATVGSVSSENEDEEEDKRWRYDYVSEEDIARENGCWIDDDGHWQPMDYDDDWF